MSIKTFVSGSVFPIIKWPCINFPWNSTARTLFDKKNNNIFASSKEEGSDQLAYAIGGLQQTIYDNFLIFAPNVNAYRRFQPDQFVPVNNSWGPNNRSVAFRIPRGKDSSKRIEHRVAGAEAVSYTHLTLPTICSV